MSDVIMTLGAPPPERVDAPSAAIVKDANRIVTVTDKRGRKLGVKRMDSGLASFRLSRILGPDAAIPAVMAQAMLYCACVSINDDTVVFPKSELQLEALVGRLDLDGLNAIQQVQRDEFGIGADAAEVAEDAKN